VLSPKTTDCLSGAKPSSVKRHFFFLKNWDLTSRLSLSRSEKSHLQLSMRTLTCTPGALTMARDNWGFWRVRLSLARTSTCPNWSRALLSNKCLKCQSVSTSCSHSDWTTTSSAKLFKGMSTQSLSRPRRVIIKKLMKLLLLSLMRIKTETKRDLYPHIIMIPHLTLSSKTTIHTPQTLWSNKKAHQRGLQSTTQAATLKRLRLTLSLSRLTGKGAERRLRSQRF
jgi:hypothetical protein